MPPKKRGHNTRGRDKIFRNAVQHVHVGVGHGVLGDINLRSVAGPVSRAGDDDVGDKAHDECAFLMELNELMLSHSTTDFRRFRWEVLELCESKALFRLNHRKIAEKLLLCLMRRDKFAEGFEAFVRLTVVFARDMREKFLAYFECFHQAINGGIFDAKGEMLADTRRLQLVFAAQVAWCREMRPYWLLLEQRKLVERVIRLYVRQMHDTKEYIRRLSAEVLASLCRMAQDLVPLVVQEACLDVVQDFETYCNATAHSSAAPTAGTDDGEEEDNDNDGSNFDEDSAAALQPGGPTVVSPSLLQAYEQNRLALLPVVDGLCFLAAEMFRGIRGSLSTNFENNYALLVYVFGLSRRPQFSGTYCAGDGTNEEDMFGFTEEDARRFVHASRWAETFTGPQCEQNAGRCEKSPTAGDTQQARQRGEVLRELVQMTGGVAIGTALRTVAEETVNSPSGTATAEETQLQGVQAPLLRLLKAVAALLEFSLPHTRLLQSLLHATDYKLLRDPSATVTLRQTSEMLLEHMRQRMQQVSACVTGTGAREEWSRFVRTCGGVLEVLTPLCVGATGLTSHARKLQGLFSPLAHEVVATCVSVSCRTNNAACDDSDAGWQEFQRATKLMLFAFMQDVLQKNYTFCLRDERRLSEGEAAPRSKGHVVNSHLSTFALALLVPVLYAACVDANAALDHLRGNWATLNSETCAAAMCKVTRAAMMTRMMCDRATHLVPSPLYLALTTTVSPSAEAAVSSLTDRDALSSGLQTFLHGVLAMFAKTLGELDEKARYYASRWADVVSAILPIVLTVVDAEKAVTVDTSRTVALGASSFAWHFREALLQVMRSVKDTIYSNNSNSNVKDNNKERGATLLTQPTAASYALFAQASTLLVQLDTITGVLDAESTQVECVGFLQDAVMVLAASFQSRHVKELNDEETGRLLHGMECLLMSLLRLFGFELECGTEVAVSASKQQQQQKRSRNSTETSEQALLTAISRLHVALDTATQRALVETLLLEALASPVHSLRVVALRLLRLLCHPGVPEAERTAGCCTIDLSFFDALLDAELFDPLSAAGNLDGVRQALAKLTFAAAAGTLRNPLQRVILGHAMVGLLHTRFAEAWPVALKMLADLVRMEDTSAQLLLPPQHRHGVEVSDGSVCLAGGHAPSFSSSPSSAAATALTKLEPLVWRGVICRYARAVVFGDILREAAAGDFNDAADDDHDDVGGDARVRGKATVWYRICLTDVQRHEKGELVSKEFATARSAAAAVTLLQLVNTDGEVLSWRRHYLPSASPTHTHGARTTDRAVLAKTFLSGLSEMTRGGAAGEGRVELVAGLVLELAAVRRGEHPDGLRQLKMLDDRLVLAMNACNVTPIASSAAVTASQERVLADVQKRLVARNEKLQTICIGFLSDANNKLQRAAIDMLQRLKVCPFSRHHAQLIPYCDTQKNLFHFLSTFHVETDIPEEDKADYIATAIAIVLPKLTIKVSKEKLKDQAILRRRVLAMVTHLSTGGGFSSVLEGLVQRLIFERVMPSGGKESTAVRFPEMWTEWVQTNSHCARRLERLVKQLLNTIQLLSALLQSVGKGFESFAGSCMHLVLNAYLISCKQILQAPCGTEKMSDDETHRRVHGALGSSTLNALLPRLRRAAAVMVSSLFEQFPAEAMAALRKDLVEVSAGDVAQSLIGRYVAMLHANSSGAIPELMSTQGSGDGARTGVTPLLRLVRAWVDSPLTMPLIGTFGDTVTAMFVQVFAYAAASSGMTRPPANAGGAVPPAVSTGSRVQQAAVLSVNEGLRCVGIILASSEEPFDMFGAPGLTTLQEAYVKPHAMTIFASLYQLILRGGGASAAAAPASAGDGRSGGASRQPKLSAPVMAFSVSMWKQMIATVTALSEYVVATDASGSEAAVGGVDAMLARLLEMCIAFVAHPASAKDRQTCITATSMLERLLPRMRHVELVGHFEPLVRLFNAVTCPEARLLLCRSLTLAFPRLVYSVDSNYCGDNVRRGSATHVAQVAAVGRAVACLNGFAEDNTDLERYDFELRFHTFRSLRQFFANNGNYRTLPAKRQHCTGEEVSSTSPAGGKQEVRQERDYSGAADVTMPLDKTEAPVLCVEAFLALTANAMFFLRDSEGTIRVLAAQLLDAMVLYASRQKERAASYDTLILERVIRREILPSLRRGIASRDAHIRLAHMQSFSCLAQYYPVAFPSFAALHSRSVERCFFANVGHLQHRCRVRALELLRQSVGRLLPRDVIRVFVPFLLVAVKDFAQGKRDLQNLTEGRAKGYCDAVLTTVAALAAALPWEGYYRVLSLFLQNARENPSLRLPMLRGVVMLLDHFHFLNDADADAEGPNKEGGSGTTESARDAGSSHRKRDTAGASAEVNDNNDEGDEEDDDEEEEDEAAAALRARRRKYRRARVVHVMEDDVLPQLYEFLGNGSRKGARPADAELRGNIHTAASVRQEMRKADNAQQNTAILQLPVAIAITKIVKRFPPERFSLHAEHLLDEVVLKLRTKSDKHRESARRILSAMLCETGPGKLEFVITKLRDHLVHGYQLHVLGYTIVTLLYNLYEPKHVISYRRKKQVAGAESAATAQGALGIPAGAAHPPRDDDDDDEDEAKKERRKNENVEDNEDAEAAAEEELVRQLAPVSTNFDRDYGVACLTSCLDNLMGILLDDYLGEVGEQKGQVELMSTMVEVKQNRALQGFTLLASHCEASRVIEVFLQKITWLLTPPSTAAAVDVSALRGSARAAAMLVQELRTKYSTVSKNAAADFEFVQKVRLLAVRVARALLKNATMQVESSFLTVRNLLQRHNEVREEKIKAFEAKDGTRRIRGNLHMTIQRAPTETRKDQLNANFLVEPRPERVDLDFSVHTVLATQQRQKLRAYRGRYGKEMQQAAKNFYREDPATAVVLDTLDEFLLKYLLSVLKQVLGIGKGRKCTTAAVRLDLLRSQKKRQQEGRSHGTEDEDEEENVDDDGGGVPSETEAGGESSSEEEVEEENASVLLEPQPLDDETGDALDRFATAAQQEEEEAHDENNDTNNQAEASEHSHMTTTRQKHRRQEVERRSKKHQPMADLTSSFTRQHQQLLESLVPIVLTTLQGEGSDAVVGHALDCMLALVSLRPPLQAVGTLHTALYDTVTAFFERGGAIKQRAMRVAAAVVAHQRFVLAEEQASQLLRLCRAELVDRGEYLPMALALFHAVLGKHIHVVEVYELIGVVTELMMHTSAKRLLRQRCIAVLARFLTEYRITPEKFRSHIDLLCRNLDYPEVTGRIAILELLGVLVYRLPTSILRQEAPLLLMPLTVTLAATEFYEARRKAGDVLQSLVKNAGLDVVVPTLSQWLAADQVRPRKAMALQAWAVMIPAVGALYDMSVEEDAQEFQSCWSWSLQALQEAATFDQVATFGTKRKREELTADLKRKLELKSWTYIFFGLRCLEGIATVAPAQVWQNIPLARRVVSCLADRLVLHVHPWIQSVALRLLRMYCHDVVELRCGYLRATDWVAEGRLVAVSRKNSASPSQKKRNGEGERAKVKLQTATLQTPMFAQSQDDSDNGSTPYVVCLHDSLGQPDTVQRALEVLDEMATAMRALLQCIALSDVPNEKYSAHRAMQQPSRTDVVSLALYFSRAMMLVSVVLLNMAVSRAGAGASSVQDTIAQHFASLRHQLHALVRPVIKHGSVANVMVRTASLVQYFGGFLAALPTDTKAEDANCTAAAEEAGEQETNAHDGTLASREAAVAHRPMTQALCWLAGHAIGLRFVRDTIVPTLTVATRCGDRSEKLSVMATQALTMLREQLETHRTHFDAEIKVPLSPAAAATKRTRLEKNRRRGKETEVQEKQAAPTADDDDAGDGAPTVDDVLFALTAETTAVRTMRKDKTTRRETLQTLRKRRRSSGGDTAARNQQEAPQRRRPSRG
ncbi:hypothetical protein TraAM80_06125 [Trypanosoma rangeli]|uniref:U3 small nucleolar RNA-associated protein 20 domain-containing protein n=1 Tax=Trypanosoma rangeli TaxID=5698 RepID=A0A3R7N9P1_TRYRA|nr:uncharacterized protein TraAM80_06125 [Trypanosoma rangeli]RNF02832.1 hypothetical protein TraAM80_06125 [Trypanosoma rangeli]|eukprot:RNF02832.1 hypothetical protein TraAM80_06125 [Trypanosoma rangeli]